MITVESGKAGIRVYIAASLNFFGTGGVRDSVTNSKGIAYIDFDDFGENFNGEIYVDGRLVYKGSIDRNGFDSV